VEITGEPTIRSTIAGGVNGDAATCAILLNAAASVVRASPGLKTMIDLPTVAYGRAEDGVREANTLRCPR
jgi:4-hydroxy-tetrahydrodipicolinate reductase